MPVKRWFTIRTGFNTISFSILYSVWFSFLFFLFLVIHNLTNEKWKHQLLFDFVALHEVKEKEISFCYQSPLATEMDGIRLVWLAWVRFGSVRFIDIRLNQFRHTPNTEFTFIPFNVQEIDTLYIWFDSLCLCKWKEASSSPFSSHQEWEEKKQLWVVHS